jgi:predicted small secreted protein
MRRTSLITKLIIVGLLGMILAACANTMEGVGKDLQNVGTSMDSKSSTNNSSQTKGKDVVVTPVK